MLEGRMRSLYYLATVIGCYRKIIDDYYSDKLSSNEFIYQEKVLSKVANRETSTHYLDHEADESDQYYTGRQEISNQDFLGLVTSYDKEKKVVTLVERNYFQVGDEVELFTPKGDVYSFIVDKMYNENMEEIEVARHPQMKVYLEVPAKLPKGSMMRLKVFDKKDYL